MGKKYETDAKSSWSREQLAMAVKDLMAPRMNELGMLAAGQLQVAGPGTKVNSTTGIWFKFLSTLMTPFCCHPYHLAGRRTESPEELNSGFRQPFAFPACI